MTIETFSALVAMLLAISLAAERLVTIVKTLAPDWLGTARLTDDKKSEHPTRDRPRRFVVQLIALAAAWITAAFLAGSTDGATAFDLLGEINFAANQGLPVPVVAVLASGGSAFWANILGYTKAVKDIRIKERDKA
jgi:hypothetical protein